MSVKDLTTGETRYLTIRIYFPGDLAPFVEQFPFNGSLSAFLKNSTFADNPKYSHIVVDLLKKGDVHWQETIKGVTSIWRVSIEENELERRWLSDLSNVH